MFHSFVEAVKLLFEILRFVVKLRSMVSPTKAKRPLGRKSTKKNRSRRPTRARRVKLPPPQIYVLTSGTEFCGTYRRAHLRNKRGYLYLSWRDGQKVHTRYLGKRRK